MREGMETRESARGEENEGSDSSGETAMLGEETRAKGNIGCQSIKARKIKIEDLTSLAESKHFWCHGQLQPRTTIAFTPPVCSMLLSPPPTPIVPRVYLPTPPTPLPPMPTPIHKQIYPPLGLREL